MDSDEDPGDAGFLLGRSDRAWTEVERAAMEKDLRQQLPDFDELGARVAVASASGRKGYCLRFRFGRPLDSHQQRRFVRWLERKLDAL